MYAGFHAYTVANGVHYLVMDYVFMYSIATSVFHQCMCVAITLYLLRYASKHVEVYTCVDKQGGKKALWIRFNPKTGDLVFVLKSLE